MKGRRPVQRGVGIGLEICDGAVRGVRVSPDAVDIVAATVHVPIGLTGDAASTYEALLHARARLGPDPASTRLAWFGPADTLHRVDATGLDTVQVNQLRQQLADDHGIGSTMIVDVGVRRWLVAIRWDHGAVAAMRDLVTQAGFVDVSVEPAPVSLQRVLSREFNVAHRCVDGGGAWAAVSDGNTIIAASSVADVPPGPVGAGLRAGRSRSVPFTMQPTDLVMAHNPSAPFRVNDASLLGPLRDAHRDVVVESFHSPTAGEPSRVIEIDERPYPDLPSDDPRSAVQIAVALGAACGAAGLGGRARSVQTAVPHRDSLGSAWRPWTVERVSLDFDEPPPRSWWRRLVDAVNALVRRDPPA